MLAKDRVFDEVVMTRLPPDHSHHYLTDGAFSVIEGWLTGNGFAGCHTVWDLIKFLRGKFSTASNYRNKRVEISVLIANFAFVKWFDGCVNADKISNIGVPLVWRHTWVPETQSVRGAVQVRHLRLTNVREGRVGAVDADPTSDKRRDGEGGDSWSFAQAAATRQAWT